MNISINITYIGYLIIPLAFIVLIFKPKYLITLLMSVSVLHASSMLNGSINNFQYGLSPYYFVAICILLRLLYILLSNRNLLFINSNIKYFTYILLVFWLWSVISAFLLPYLFQGVEVYNPRLGLELQYKHYATLEWTFSNLAQAIYLTLNMAVIIYAFLIDENHSLYYVTIGIKLAIIIVCFLGIWQVLSSYLILQFPYNIFNSNISYYQGYNQYIGSIRRLVSSFSEPSFAGAFLASIEVGLLSLYLINSLSKNKQIFLLILSLVILYLLIWTFSTTGYLSLLIGNIILLFKYKPFHRNRKSIYTKKWYNYFIGVVIIFVSILCITISHKHANINVDDIHTGYIVNEGILSDIGKMLSSAFIKDTKSDSFVHRTAADIYALKIFVSTYGLGAGLGSSRSSSLITTLLSTIGIIGVTSFIMLIYSVIRGIINIHCDKYSNICNYIYWSLLTLLIAHCISIPDISFPPLWTSIITYVTVDKCCYHNTINKILR